MNVVPTQPQTETAEPTVSAADMSVKGRGYSLLILTLVFTCHIIDRGLPNILLEPVRQEFNLTDSQLGLFSGLAFAVAFSIAILPMGYLSDRVNRRNLLAGVLLIWSLLTALTGFSRNFLQLIVVRFGIGLAEAGGAPLTLPMISDMYPPQKRASAIGLLYMSGPIAGFVSAAVGGWIAAEHGWRAAFFIAGLPGVLLALLLVLTVREPRRGRWDEPAPEASKAEPQRNGLGEAFRHLVRKPALIGLIAAGTVFGLLNITLAAWMGSFFIRVHGLGLKEVGLILGLGAGLCATAAPPLMGWLADRLAPRNPRWPLRLIWGAGLLAMAVTLTMLFTPSLAVAVGAFMLADVLRSGYTPPLYSLLMNHTPAPIRGGVMSIMQLSTNLIGFGLGPLLAGALSDHFGGGANIRYALALVSLLFVLVAVLLIAASRGLFGARSGKPA